MLLLFSLSSINVYQMLFMDPNSYFCYFNLTNNNPQTTINCSFSFDNNVSLCRIINLNLIMNPYQSFKIYYLDSSIVQISLSRFTYHHNVCYRRPRSSNSLSFLPFSVDVQSLYPWYFGLIASYSPKKD